MYVVIQSSHQKIKATKLGKKKCVQPRKRKTIIIYINKEINMRNALTGCKRTENVGRDTAIKGER